MIKLTVSWQQDMAVKGFEQAAREVSEISCHARGVHYLVPTAGTIIDIGGQDAKAIRVDSNGSLDDFIMNDKCAAWNRTFSGSYVKSS